MPRSGLLRSHELMLYDTHVYKVDIHHHMYLIVCDLFPVP